MTATATSTTSSTSDPSNSSASAPTASACPDCQMLQEEFAKNPGGKPVRNKGLILAAVAGGSALAVSAVCLPFVTPALRRACLPFVPATEEQVSNVFRALAASPSPGSSVKAGRSLVDIGSGDGRIVLEAARRGFRAHGIELNYWLVLYSRLAAARTDLGAAGGKATFSREDLWKANLSCYDDIVIFGGGDLMVDLESKLDEELSKSSKPDQRVVACRFPFPNWTPTETVGSGIDTVWLYHSRNRMKS